MSETKTIRFVLVIHEEYKFDFDDFKNLMKTPETIEQLGREFDDDEIVILFNKLTRRKKPILVGPAINENDDYGIILDDVVGVIKKLMKMN